MKDNDQAASQKGPGYKNVQNSLLELKRVTHQIVCLRNVSRLLSASEKSVDEILNSLVHMIPEGWQYSDQACARIVLDNKEVRSANFAQTRWKQSAEIQSAKGVLGTIEVYYLESKPKADEGPFLSEERYLIDIVAMELGAFFNKKQIEMSEKRQRRELEIYGSLLRHDLINDVGVILSNVDLARMIAKKDDNDLIELLGSIEATSNRMMSLLKAFSRKSDLIETNIAEMVTKACSQAHEVNMRLTVHLTVDDNCTEVGVPESRLLPMVFDNLLRNAAVHAGESPRVEVKVFKDEGSVCIIISDDGPGVEIGIRDNLFQKGVSTRGGGLGLYLSREIVTAIGGAIELVESPPGRGATFKVVLPVAS